MPTGRELEVRTAVQAAADVTVLLVFVTLGANLPFGDLADHALPALATVAARVAVARPLTVLACLPANRAGRWEPGELAFVAWTRETGVVPAALAGLLVAEGVPYEPEIVTAVAMAIVVTLAVQSTTKAWLARRLGLGG